ncbi:MAG: CBS domain-containing protein [Xanthobacteraceae bacterium]
MKASDIMSTDVVTVGPDANVQQVADLLVKHRISGLPVVDASGRVVGLVSEGDLLRRADAGTGHERSWWLKLLIGSEGLAREYIHEHSRQVSDVMSREIITASPDTPVSDLAEILEKHRIKRVPIVKDGKLVGIVSRANLLHGLVSLRNEIPAKPVADSELREVIQARIRAEPWISASLVNVTVTSGTADIWGIVDTSAEKKALRVLVETTPGVTAVNDNIIIRPVVSGT